MTTPIKKSPRSISGYQSYSGKDYKFLFYVPYRGGKELVDKALAAVSNLSKEQQRTPVNNSQVQVGNREVQSLKRLESVLKSYQNGMVGIEIKSIQTFSFQIHTDIQRVVATRYKSPRGYTVGNRLVAGSIICTVLDEHPFMEVMELVNVINLLSKEENLEYEAFLSVLYNVESSSSVVDEIPPMNIIVTAKNEIGDSAQQIIYGLKLINDGSVYSVQDILTEATFTFVAQDIDVLRSMGRGDRNPSQSLLNVKRGSALVNTPAAQARRQLKRGFLL